MQAILALEDGRIFRGKGFGAPVEASGEVVFNTSLTGYQEIFTDPSYAGQIVVLDQSAHRELWNDAQRCRVRAALYRGPGNARVLRDEFQLEGHRGRRRLS